MTPSSELRSRILASAAQVQTPTRAQAAMRRLWLFAGGTIGALAIFGLKGGVRPTGRSVTLMMLTSVGTSVFVGVGMYVLFTRRARSMLRRRAGALVGMVALSAIGFVAWRYVVSLAYESVQEWPTRIGYRCFALGLAMGSFPLFAALMAWRRTDPLSPAVTGAAFGAGAGLGSAALTDLWCPVSYPPHLLLGHVLPILVLAAIGGGIGRVTLGIKRHHFPT